MPDQISLEPMASSARNSGQLLEWNGGKFDGGSSKSLTGRHRLAAMDLFNDSVLIDLLDSYPRNRLQAWTMGSDLLRREDWKPVDTTGVSGRDLLQAVKKGRLWYNILRLDLFDRKYREIIDELYDVMASDCPHLKPTASVGTLLLSSPNALVYYHADGPPTTLFHVRGEKRMWVYPAADTRFISQFFMEEIYGSAMDEEVPYSPEFDDYAEVFELVPGSALWWPHNAPHRIENGNSFNVSLSTRYQTEKSERRKLVYVSNRFFRRKLRLNNLSVAETGMISHAKCFGYRVCRKAGFDRNDAEYVYMTDLQVDPESAMGYSKLPQARKPPFSH